VTSAATTSPGRTLHRSAGHARDGVSFSGYAVFRGEMAPDDALARELDAMELV